MTNNESRGSWSKLLRITLKGNKREKAVLFPLLIILGLVTLQFKGIIGSITNQFSIYNTVSINGNGSGSNVINPIAQSNLTQHKQPTRPGQVTNPQCDNHLWCIIGDNSFWGVFAHTAQIIYPCWSYIDQHQRQNQCGNAKCSFLLSSSLNKNVLEMEHGHLGSKLMHAMNCTLQVGEEVELRSGVYGKVNSSNIFIKRGFETGISEDVIWFLKMKEDAHDLRDKFISLYSGEERKNEILQEALSTSTKLRIGLLNRKKSRGILNMKKIKLRLHQTYPEADIDSTYFEGTSFEYQAEWFATKDVIFAPHGAALIWSAFIQSETIVIQAYPPKYYPNRYFEPLINISGGYSYDWHLGDRPFLDYMENIEQRKINRAKSFSVPVDEVIDIFLNATTLHQSCERRICKY